MLVKTIEQSRSLEGNLQADSRESESSSMLVSLPAELQTEIMMSLTWKDILHMRMTCKLLSEVTKLRAIWAHLVEEHISNSHYPPRLECPIELHSSIELEHLFLRWKSTDAAFAAENIAPARERRFCSKQPIAYMHLVEGGRWLLIADFGGAVTYYDLDAERITGKSLIPRLIQRDSVNKVIVSIDYNIQSPTLKFTMALWLEDESKHNDSKMFQVWSISLLLDSSEHGIGLVASRLATFYINPKVYGILSLSIFGPDLAFVGYHSDYGRFHIFTVCWMDVNSRSSPCPWEGLYKAHTRDVPHLLSCGRLLIISLRNITLYDYTASEEDTQYFDTGSEEDTEDFDPPSLPYLWDYGLDWNILHPSRPLYTHIATRFTFIVENVTSSIASIVYSIDIDNDPHSEAVPPLIKRGDISTKLAKCYMGPYLCYSRGIVLQSEGRGAELLQCPPEYCADGPSSTKFLSFKHPIPSGRILMDELTGRVVIPRFSLKKLSIVIDLALSYR